MKWLAFASVLAGCSADTFIGADGAAPTDGSAGDVVLPTDGGARDACTPTSTACAANAQCNSFDNGPNSLPPWSDISENGGQVSFESDLAVTCPDGLVAALPVASVDQPVPRAAIGGSAQITGIATAHASVELDMIFPKAPTGGATFLFMYPNTDSQNGIGVVWSGAWYLHDSVTNDQVQIDPRTDTWNHVRLDITFAQSGGAGVVELDYTDSNGTLQKPKLTKSTLGGTVPTITAITFGIGIAPLGSTTAPMKLFIDDVVFSPF